jgi:hypothetical protein
METVNWDKVNAMYTGYEEFFDDHNTRSGNEQQLKEGREKRGLMLAYILGLHTELGFELSKSDHNLLYSPIYLGEDVSKWGKIDQRILELIWHKTFNGISKS